MAPPIPAHRATPPLAQVFILAVLIVAICPGCAPATPPPRVKDRSAGALRRIESQMQSCPPLRADAAGTFVHHGSSLVFPTVVNGVHRRDLKRIDVNSRRPVQPGNCGRDALISYHHPDFAFVFFVVAEPQGGPEALLFEIQGGGHRQAVEASFSRREPVSLADAGMFANGRHLVARSRGNIWDPRASHLGQEWFVFVQGSWGLAIQASYPARDQARLAPSISAFLAAFVARQGDRSP